MSRMDSWIQQLPGSIPFKSFVAACVLCTVIAIPVFQKKPEESRQGHDYLSSEKPEIIRATQEQLRKEYRHQRNAKIAETSESTKAPVQDVGEKKA
jgi:hypothetical protein